LRHLRNGHRQQLGLDATRKLPGEGFKPSWPPLIKMDAEEKAKVEQLRQLHRISGTWFGADHRLSTLRNGEGFVQTRRCS